MIAPSALQAGKARPSFADMIRSAVNEMKGSSKGSSRIAIKNYITANFYDLPEAGRFNYHLRSALNKLVDSKVLLNTGAYFKLSKQANGTVLKKSVAKPKATRKTTTGTDTKKTTKAAPSSTKQKTKSTTTKAKKAPSSLKKKPNPQTKAVAALKKTKKAAAASAATKKKTAPTVKKVTEPMNPPAEAAASPPSPAVSLSPTCTASPPPLPFQTTAVEATQMA